MSIADYAVNFRGFTACPCQAAWLPVFERRLQHLGIISGQLRFAQLIGGFSGSGGTHTTGGATDIWLFGDTARRAVAVARDMGADATWHRLAGWDGPGSDEHVHSVLRGCPHLSSSARAQISAVEANGDGLGGTSTPDPGPRPLSGRTWRQGLEWALNEEDDMADEATQRKLDDILQAAKNAAEGIAKLRSAQADRAVADRRRDEAIAEGLDKLAASITTRAGKDQVRKLKELLQEHDAEEATP